MPIFQNGVWYNNDGTPMYQPGGEKVLLSSAYKIFIISSATAITSTGLITGITASAFPPANTVVNVYIFAQAGLPAGMYYAKFSSDTSCQLYTNAAATVTPTGITPAAYASSNSDAILASVVLPAGALGLNGILSISAAWSMNFDSIPRTGKIIIGSTTLVSDSMASMSWQSRVCTVQNRASFTSQAKYSTTWGGDLNGASALTAIDTSVAQTIQIVGNLGNAVESLLLDSFSISYTAIN